MANTLSVAGLMERCAFCVLRSCFGLVSGSIDGTLRVWDVVDGKCLQIWVVGAGVCFVEFDGERVVSGGHDFTIKVWNVHAKEYLHTLTGHTEPLDSLLFEPERDLVVSGSNDGTIRVWDVQRGTCLAHFAFHERSRRLSGWFGMQLRGNTLVLYYDSDIWVWDIREGGSCIRHLHGGNCRTENITSMQWLDSGLLVTGSMNGSVKLWDVQKGTFVRELVRSRSGDPGRYYYNLEASETLLQRIAIVHQITGFLLRNSEIDFRDFRRQQFVLNAELIPLFVDFDDVVEKGNGGDDAKTATQIYRSMIYEFLAVGANETQLSTLRDLDQVHDRGQLSVHLLDDFLSRL
ncbi:unnamed protein product, partial [Mesorhabditis belari]|uniref:Guanine nucleotide-binding protein subunit beta-like protein n=1 Tax=Mesorhabditis belari TaxID=2138241 RepID=A0AAF3F158_9BILA